jgi:hypothetical protein
VGETGPDWIGLDWTGLDWIGLDWTGLDWTAAGHILMSLHWIMYIPALTTGYQITRQHVIAHTCIYSRVDTMAISQNHKSFDYAGSNLIDSTSMNAIRILSHQSHSIRFTSICFDSMWSDPIRFDSIWFDWIWFELIRIDLIRIDSIWFDSIRFDLIRIESNRFCRVQFISMSLVWHSSMNFIWIRYYEIWLNRNSWD